VPRRCQHAKRLRRCVSFALLFSKSGALTRACFHRSTEAFAAPSARSRQDPRIRVIYDLAIPLFVDEIRNRRVCRETEVARQERTAVAAEISTRECETSGIHPAEKSTIADLKRCSLPATPSIRPLGFLRPGKNSAREKTAGQHRDWGNLSVRPLLRVAASEIDFRDSPSEPEFLLNCKLFLQDARERSARSFTARFTCAHSLSLSLSLSLSRARARDPFREKCMQRLRIARREIKFGYPNIDGSNVSRSDTKLRERRWNASGNNKQMRVYNRAAGR